MKAPSVSPLFLPASSEPGNPTAPRRAARPVAAPLRRVAHVREPLSEQALRVMASLSADEGSVGVLADRFPHVLNRLAEKWGSPNEVLSLIAELLVDRRGNRHGFPREGLDELMLMQRCCVARKVTSTDQQDPPR
jgi:hypothetical protein